MEALLGAHELLGERAELRLIEPEEEFRYRAVDSAEPLRSQPERTLTVAQLLAGTGATIVRDRLVEVREQDRTLLTRDGDLLPFDYLLIAVGARPQRALRQGAVWRPGQDPAVLAEILAGLASGAVARAGVVIPRGVRWPLPGYELALVLGWTAQAPGRVTLVTAERRPLEALGPDAIDLVTGELTRAEVELITGVEAHDATGAEATSARLRLTREPPSLAADALVGRPSRPSEDDVVTEPSSPVEPTAASGPSATLEPTPPASHQPDADRLVEFDRLLSLPTVSGPMIGGVASDAAGFVVVDEQLRALGGRRVWAAGSCLAAALEHSALAAQQADAAIAEIAAEFGVRAAAPASPLELTGILLRGQRERWLAANPPATNRPSTLCLWWPTGRALGPRLAQRIAALDPAVRHGLGVVPPGLAVRVRMVMGAPATVPPSAGGGGAAWRRAQRREVAERQLLAVERHEHAAEAQLQTLRGQLQSLDSDMKTIVSELRRAGYLRGADKRA